MPTNPTARDVQLMREQGFLNDVVVAVVRNVGRLAVSVESVSASTEDGWGFQVLADPTNPSLPHRLEPGAKESWHVELRPVQLLVDQDGKARKTYMDVELGTGKVLKTKNSVLVVPSVPSGPSAVSPA